MHVRSSSSPDPASARLDSRTSSPSTIDDGPPEVVNDDLEASTELPRPSLERARAARTRARHDPTTTQLRQRLDAIERMKQQAAAEGMRFEDSNANGRVDDSDLVRTQAGQMAFGEIDPNLRGRMLHRSKRIEVVRDYASRPVDQRIGWTTGFEQANPDFWDSNGQTWRLSEGRDPASAISDLYEHSGAYSTECAQARTSLEAYAELAHRRERDGELFGNLAFNRDFIESHEERAQMDGYLERLGAIPREDREAWAADNPPPEVDGYDLEIDGHTLTTGGQALGYLNETPGGAPGANGYFHNLGVSPAERAAGWVGENVIDLGEQGGQRQLWGHPGQVKSVEGWQAELGGRQVKSPGELASRLSSPEGRGALGAEGRFGSREGLQRWMRSPEFADAFERGTGRAYAGDATLASLSVADLRAVVAAELPETATLKTEYGQAYAGVEQAPYSSQPQTLDWHIAHLLKDGGMPVPFGFDAPQ